MCEFCKIVKGEIKPSVVYEDDMVMALLDIDPIHEGHTLLIPKEHYLDADDVPEELLGHLMNVSRQIVRAIKKTYQPPGYSVMQNGGKYNDIGHYHMHIFPRFDSDEFGWCCKEKQWEYTQEIADNIKHNI